MSDFPLSTEQSDHISFRETLWFAVLGAMVAGAVHVFYVQWRIHVLHQFTWTSRELPWFSPLAYLACFLLLAIPLALLSLAWPRIVTRQLQVGLLATLTLFAICLHVQNVHPLAELALSLGAGFQIARLVAGNHVQSCAEPDGLRDFSPAPCWYGVCRRSWAPDCSRENGSPRSQAATPKHLT